MRIDTTVLPSVEPITLAEAKAHCKIDISDDDAVVSRLIVQAREFVENYCQISLITQTKKVYYDRYDFNFYRFKFRIPVSPLRAILSFKAYAPDGTESIFAPESYYLSGISRVTLVDGYFWPNDVRVSDSVVLEVTCGFGDTAADVPASLKLAMLKLIAHNYDNRAALADPITSGSTPIVPFGITADLAPYRFYI